MVLRVIVILLVGFTGLQLAIASLFASAVMSTAPPVSGRVEGTDFTIVVLVGLAIVSAASPFFVWRRLLPHTITPTRLAVVAACIPVVLLLDALYLGLWPVRAII